MTVTPDTPLVDVINLMSQVQDSGCAADSLNSSLDSGEFRQERASCVLVVEGTQLVGIFTEGDVVRLVASGMDFSGITIAVVMVQPVVTLKQSQAENVFAVLSLMQQHKIYHIPILNQHEELVGIVTQTNLLQAFDCVKTFGVAALQQQQQARRVEQQSIELIQVNQELQEALVEEVQIVEEELREQNEELASTRQEIELERQRYQDLFDFAPEAYVITDIAGKIQQANQAAATLLCVPQNRLVGKPLVIFIAKSDRKTFRTQLSQLQQKQNWEVYFQPRKGTPFPAAIAVTSMHNSQGQRVGLRWLIRDITYFGEKAGAIISDLASR
ncbi:CBS domain-containing protein, partial [Brasilonema sp. UFV-L1]|uniref:CBS domain-containing protein n=1 Tax=Brasilonema sp. UFV-L1 TaxID=2234130 RepID=UPI00145E2C7E